MLTVRGAPPRNRRGTGTAVGGTAADRAREVMDLKTPAERAQGRRGGEVLRFGPLEGSGVGWGPCLGWDMMGIKCECLDRLKRLDRMIFSLEEEHVQSLRS